MINVFDINDNLVTNTHNINGSSVYFIDNFYKNPDELVKLLKNTKCGLHKSEENPSFNGVYFEDKRHKFKHDGMNKVSKTISEIIGQPVLHDTNQVMTNISTYKSTEFNDSIKFKYLEFPSEKDSKSSGKLKNAYSQFRKYLERKKYYLILVQIKLGWEQLQGLLAV